jgi:transposase
VDRFIERCAGLDVHKASVKACVRVPDGHGGRRSETRTFRTTTAGLVLLGDWLASHQVQVVGMESTGVFWKPVYYLLEDDVECWLLNAQHLKNVPGRKTDVADAAWIAQLVEHGLVRPSFVPPRPIRELRELTRYRKALIYERTRETQRLHKVLEDAGIKLGCVASDVLGVSGRAMLEALVGGTTDPEVLAELARGSLRNKLPALREALQGRVARHHRLLVAELLAHLDYLEEAIERLSGEVARVIAPFSPLLALLCTIPGVDRRTAEVILAEIGVDMTRFPTAGHLASWAGLCPGNNESAGKHFSGKTRKGSRWLRTTLSQAANAAAAAKAPTWPPTTPASRADAGTSEPSWRWRTRSWCSPGTCSPATSRTPTWEATTSWSVSTARRTRTGWSASWSAWATRSPWSRPRSPDQVPAPRPLAPRRGFST